jgi:hypothetical protein
LIEQAKELKADQATLEQKFENISVNVAISNKKAKHN